MTTDPWEQPGSWMTTWGSGEAATETTGPDDAGLDDPASAWPEGTPDAPLQPRRWVWDAMEPEERAIRLKELAGWVSWLRGTYQLRNEIPACWYRHRPVVERLTALYAAWARAYIAPAQGRDHAELEWIGAMDNMIPRLNLAACSPRHSEPPTRRHDAEAEAKDLSDFFADGWPAEAPVMHPAQAESAHLNPPL
ncbi:hypothetical protein [Streptomyces sp. G-5]|uniref:hypothetical protein n=1 Tax=Streptomyces sp. G-5 TaxID=2977231 RepID=UPI0021D3D460|nr:hypothetical protein [Streptomyces sp. G-5]MCU4750306.1 hypothetical protein [Streptomyces sp. G-5]